MLSVNGVFIKCYLSKVLFHYHHSSVTTNCTPSANLSALTGWLADYDMVTSESQWHLMKYLQNYQLLAAISVQTGLVRHGSISSWQRVERGGGVSDVYRRQWDRERGSEGIKTAYRAGLPGGRTTDTLTVTVVGCDGCMGEGASGLAWGSIKGDEILQMFAFCSLLQ